jgi:hypothetical protein
LRKIFCYSLLLLLAGCRSESLITPQSNGTSVEVKATASDQVQDETKQQSNSNSVWDILAAKHGNENENGLGLDAPDDPDLFYLYLEGLAHSNPYVEWYASNKIIEFADHPDEQKAIDALRLLLKSPNDKVKSSAQFALNVVEHHFDDPAFIRSPDGKRVAFHQYLEARYNDGKVWIYDLEANSVYLLNGNWLSVERLIWSPDSKKLAIEFGGRIWGSIDLVNPDKSESLLKKTVEAVITDKKYYPVVKQQRSDYYCRFIEWSPDSSKALMSYTFTDDEYKNQQGIVVYDLMKAAYTTIKKYPAVDGLNVEIVKPDGFKW